MQIIFDYPPMFGEIDGVFRVLGKPIIYAWGDKIFNPKRIIVTPELLAHETAHGRRQLAAGVTDWWSRYLEDPRFRLDEEIAAHRAEYRWLLNNGNRQQRKSALKHVANKLAAPLYGGLISPIAARSLLLG